MYSVHLGTWTVPSGNVLDVYVMPERRDGTRKIFFRWDRGVSCLTDLEHYYEVIEPDLLSRLREYLEIPSTIALSFGPVEARR